MMKPLLLVAMATSLLGAAQFVAGQIPAAPPRATHGSPAEKAITAYRDGRPYSAAKLARPLAENGDPDALFLMALLLDSTREPLRLSRGQAMIHYYRLAETAGHPEAASRRQLTVMASGSKNERKAAIDSLASAADQGDNRAARILGEAWLRGFVDGKPDPAKAIQLWSKAADAGDAPSLLLLGKLQSGNLAASFKPDPAAAIESYRRAAATTNPDAYLPLGELLLTTHPDEGKAWLEKAIASDIPEAHRVLGDHALTAGKEHEAARNHYLKGAEAGSSPCMRRLAILLLSTPVSATEGLQWLHKAADQGDPRAAAELGQRLCTRFRSTRLPRSTFLPDNGRLGRSSGRTV
jgi:TPR repeat protein